MNRLYRLIGIWLLATTLNLWLLAPLQAQTESPHKEPLKEKDDPLLIGQRNINKGQIDFYSLEKERALGREMALEIDRNATFVDDPVITEYVNRLGQNLVINSDAKVPFTIKVLNTGEINAFALPGGFLYVNRGLLEAASNEAEVASVLAHEIAHVAARHGVEQASKGELLNWASLPLIFFGGWGAMLVSQAASIALPLTFLKFSRGAEKEADRLAAQYLWKAGYDPTALLTFFEKLQAQEKNKAGTLAKLFRSHPMNAERSKAVRALLTRFPEKTAYQFNSSDFVRVQNRLRIGQKQVQRLRSRPTEEHRRPTLKRRRPVNEQESTAPRRPTLKRRSPDS